MIRIEIKKDDIELISSLRNTKVFQISNDRLSKKVLKQIKVKDSFRYILCSAFALDKENSYVYSEGELLGTSISDIATEDVELVL